MNNNEDNKSFINTIKWVILVFVIILFVILIISTIVQMLAPTFFPERNISVFLDVLQTTNTIMGVLSLIFAIISLILSFQSGKQANDIINGVTTMNKKQEIVEHMLMNGGANRCSFSNVPPNRPSGVPPTAPDNIDN